MARIPIYEQQTTVQGGGRTPFMDAPRLDDSVARAVGNLSSALGQAHGTAVQIEVQKREAVARQEEQDAIAWASQTLADRRLRWTEHAERAKESAGPGGSGYTPQLLAAFDKDAAATIEAAPSPRAKEIMALRMADLRTSLGQGAIQWEAGQRVEYRFGQIETGIAKAATLAEMDPSQFEAAHAEQLVAIDALDLPPDLKDKLTAQANDKIASAAVLGMVRKAPRTMLKELSSDKPSKNPAVAALSIEDKLRLRNAAESEVRTMDAEARAAQAVARAEFERGVADATTMTLTLGYSPRAPSRAQFVAMYGEKEGARRANAFAKIAELGSDMAAVGAMSYDEQTAMLAKRKPDADTDGFADAQKRYEALARATVETRKQYEADPAAYLLTRNPAVKEAYDAMAAAVADPQATSDAKQRASSRYFEAVTAEQARMAAPGVKPSPLPKNYVDAIVGQFATASKDGKGVAELVGGLAEQWGDKWPAVYGQLAEDGKMPTTALVIGAGMKPGPAGLLAEAARLPDKDLRTGLADGDVRDIEDALTNEMSAFESTLMPMAGGLETASGLRESARQLAIMYTRQGESPADAAARAARDVALERYNVVDTYRVPVEHDADTIERGARRALDPRKLNDVAVPPSLAGLPEAEAGEAYRAAVADAGYWATSPDESGLVLYANGAAVMRSDGTPYTLPWSELRKIGERADPIRNVPRAGHE